MHTQLFRSYLVFLEASRPPLVRQQLGFHHVRRAGKILLPAGAVRVPIRV